jgi:hypothetical protein
MERRKENGTKLFTQVHLDVQCVLFFKTLPTIDPVDFVHRICEEIVATPKIRRMRYINRLTPMTMFGKATEKGIEELSRVVLGKVFSMIEPKDDGEHHREDLKQETTETRVNYSVSLCHKMPPSDIPHVDYIPTCSPRSKRKS